MLERDVGQDDHGRVEHVGRVEAAAETGLDRGDVDAGGGELRERRRGQHLELRRPQALGRGTNALDRAFEVCLGAADPDPLGPAGHVGRVVAARQKTLVRQRLLDRPRRRPLPVRADDVDRAVRALRIAELREQRDDPVEPEPVLRPGAQSFYVFNRRAHRARPGTAPTCPSRPRRRPAAPFRRSARSPASARRARPLCAAARSRRRYHPGH